MTHFEFDSLVLSSSDFLHPYALSLTNNGEDAKDLYQETMLRALSNRDKYQWGTNLKGWLCIIMRNIFINQYRRNKRFTKVSSEAPTEVFQFDMGEIARNDGFSNVRMGEIQSAIADLPPVFRLCFEMHHAGYKYAEIADFLKEPLGTIKSRIHFARKALMKKLDR